MSRDKKNNGYIKEMKAWVKVQLDLIESTILGIRQSEQIINIEKEHIKNEKALLYIRRVNLCDALKEVSKYNKTIK